jgi:hypothetical protein
MHALVRICNLSLILTHQFYIGYEIFVPLSIIHEALDYRCEHTNIEIGSIKDILRDTCEHISNAKEIPRYLRVNETPKRRNLSTEIKQSGKSQVEFLCGHSTSGIEKKSDIQRTRPKSASSIYSSARIMPSPTGVCEEELNDFRQSFYQLLRQNGFLKVPGLNEYFFYWNKTHQAPSPINLPNLEDLVNGTLKDVFIINNSFIIFSYIFFKRKK